MKVCILSDSHDHIPLLDAAVSEAKSNGAEMVLHCGDVVAPSTLKCLLKHRLQVHLIHGNHYHGMDAGITLHDKRIFLVHYPHYARAMAATGNWDLVCCGHSHKAKVQWVPNMKGGKTLLVNPGTVGGVGTDPATYVMADLEALDFEVCELSKSIEREAGFL